ncbi:hypothetical protein E8E14_014127 [Neopestalotiopsis sp. 37M]|nr:hypothetical protein E8E14_014127 [Neopestalotiopsis sp. 37M]
MGIEGLWDAVRDVVGGEPIPLAHVNADWVRQNGRPMRIAVDTPLAIFQYKSATEHATLHILRTGVQPIFVFDGPNKPQKSGRPRPQPRDPHPYVPSRSSERTEEMIRAEYDLDHISDLAKQIFTHLGIPWRIADGEAEAECAELEKAEIVDAVLTRDGDALVFGSRFVLEKLPADNGTALVRVVRMDHLEKKNGKPRDPDSIITRKHLLQLALMSGGDYDKGISGPAVTSLDELQSWAEKIKWAQPIDMSRLRTFTELNFDWRFAHFCGKFVRTLADTALVKALWLSHEEGIYGSDLFEAITKEEDKLGGRVRLSFRPSRVISIDPKKEVVNKGYQANLKDEVFDPSVQQREWFPKWLVQMTAPRKYQAWEQEQSGKGNKNKKRKPAEHVDTAVKRPRGRPRKQQASNRTTGAASPQILDKAGLLPALHSRTVLGEIRRDPNTPTSIQASKSTLVPLNQREASYFADMEVIDLTGD